MLCTCVLSMPVWMCVCTPPWCCECVSVKLGLVLKEALIEGMLAAQGVQIVGTPVKNSSQNNVAGVQINKPANQGQPVYPIKAVTARVNPTTVSKPKTAAVPGAPKNPKGRPRTGNRIVGKKGYWILFTYLEKIFVVVILFISNTCTVYLTYIYI